MARDPLPTFRGQGNRPFGSDEASKARLRGQEVPYNVNGAPAGGDAATFDGELPAYYLARANHTGTQAAATISDFSEAVDDRVGALLIEGAGIDLTYDDGAGTLTVASTVTAYTDEMARDALGTALVAGSGIAITPDDGADTITVALARNAAMMKKSVDQTAADYTGGVAIAWDAEVYDDGGWHDNATNNSRLTVPSGVTRVRAGGNVLIANGTNNVAVTLLIRKNGSNTYDGAVGTKVASNGAVNRHSVVSGPIPVAAGDYLELFLQYATDTSIDITASETNFWAEAC